MNYLTATQLARALGVTRARIHQLTTTNSLPGAIRVGHYWFYPPHLADLANSDTWPDGSTKRRRNT